MGADDLDQIEDFYSNELEKVDVEFLEKLKGAKKSDKPELEKELKEKLAELQKEYEKKVSAFLKKHKSFGDEKEEDKSKKDEEEDKDEIDMSKPFNPKRVSLELGTHEFKERWALFKFKERIQAKKAWENFVPNFLKVFFIKVKFFIKKFWNQFRDGLLDFLSWFSESFSNLLDHTKEFFKKVVSFLKKIADFLSMIKNKILGKKSEKEEGKEEGKGEESSEPEEKKEEPEKGEEGIEKNNQKIKKEEPKNSS